ncbi:hypothetical protein CVCC1112_951 [Paenarthrobacter nicotinovorans]|nr:hypothetical protein CVCC1112_951 [Paenarthrobacter nicotinovorans]
MACVDLAGFERPSLGHGVLLFVARVVGGIAAGRKLRPV